MNSFARRRKWRRRNYRPYFYGGYYPYFFNYYKEIKNSPSDDFYFEKCPDSLNSICHDDTDKEKKIYCGFYANLQNPQSKRNTPLSRFLAQLLTHFVRELVHKPFGDE